MPLIAFGVGVAGVAALIGTGPAATAAVEEVAVAGETEAVTPLADMAAPVPAALGSITVPRFTDAEDDGEPTLRF